MEEETGLQQDSYLPKKAGRAWIANNDWRLL